MTQPPDIDDRQRAAIARLVGEAGLGRLEELIPLAGGANNRLLAVRAAEGSAALKIYFHHAHDPRDRLAAEWGFSTFVWQAGLREVPRPLAVDRQARLALYELAPGRRLEPGQVTAAHVVAASRFVSRLNRQRTAPAAAALPNGSEACFSIGEHLACVDRRVARLEAIEPATAVARQARQFAEQLAHDWCWLRASVVQRARRAALACDAVLPAAARCLSPSDFGFHNALVDGCQVRFLDFEYAGWDDPAKLVCDFFCQPAVPVPLEHWERLVAPLFEGEPLDDAQPATDQRQSRAQRARSAQRARAGRARCELLLCVYQVKWCAILLNEFLPLSQRRRRFALGTTELAERQNQQLIRARRALDRAKSLAQWPAGAALLESRVA